jgi:hypothetical protein
MTGVRTSDGQSGGLRDRIRLVSLSKGSGGRAHLETQF